MSSQWVVVLLQCFADPPVFPGMGLLPACLVSLSGVPWLKVQRACVLGWAAVFGCLGSSGCSAGSTASTGWCVG
jgi:hypothetical protein